jgi:hypothetical protein
MMLHLDFVIFERDIVGFCGSSQFRERERVEVVGRRGCSLGARDVNEAKLPMSELGLGSCATRLLNELLVDMKLYSTIKRYIPV